MNAVPYADEAAIVPDCRECVTGMPENVEQRTVEATTMTVTYSVSRNSQSKIGEVKSIGG